MKLISEGADDFLKLVDDYSNLLKEEQRLREVAKNELASERKKYEADRKKYEADFERVNQLYRKASSKIKGLIPEHLDPTITQVFNLRHPISDHGADSNEQTPPGDHPEKA